MGGGDPDPSPPSLSSSGAGRLPRGFRLDIGYKYGLRYPDVISIVEQKSKHGLPVTA
jgi:hypothetical protein